MKRLTAIFLFAGLALAQFPKPGGSGSPSGWTRTGTTLSPTNPGDTLEVGTTAPGSAGIVISPTQGIIGPNTNQAVLLPHWRAALGKVAAGTANAKILFIGDSTQFYGSNATTLQMRYNGLSSYIASQFSGIGITSEANGWLGNGGNRGAGSETSQYDGRLTVGSGWSKTGATFPGGDTFSATSSTSSLAFLPTVNVDTFVIYFFQFGGGGSYKWNINGGSDTTKSTNGTNSIQTLTVTGSLTSNTLNLNWVSGTVYILGIDAYDSSKKQVLTLNGGWVGSQSSDWSGALNIFSVPNTLSLGQDLSVICLGINDANNSVSPSTFQANLSAIVTAAQAVGDVLLYTYTPTDPSGHASYATQQSFQAVIQGLAASAGTASFDIFGRWVSYAVTNPLGLYNDSVHPNGPGYADQARGLFSVIGRP